MTRHRKSSPPRRQKNRAFRQRAIMEALEPRQLLSGIAFHQALLFRAAPKVWTINGGAGNDAITIRYNTTTKNLDLTVNGTPISSRSPAGVRAIVINGGKGNDTIKVDTGGYAIPTAINGGTGDDDLAGGGGPNSLYGGAGNDILRGGKGVNHLFGGAGNDNLIYGAGVSTLDGGAGSNTLYALQRRDKVIKGPGNHVIFDSHPTSAHHDIVTNPDAWDPSLVHLTNQELRQQLIDEAVAKYQSWFGQPVQLYEYPGTIAYNNQSYSNVTTNSVSSTPGTPGTDHSDTNNQVQGVDEADLVETDGNYIYRLGQGQLSIIDVRDPAAAHVVSTTQFSGWGAGLYLVGGRVVVLTTDMQPQLAGGANLVMPVYYGGTQLTTAWTFDVSDPSAPSLVSKTQFKGSLTTSRVIGNQLYLVLGSYNMIPPPQQVPIVPVDGNTPTNSLSTGERYQTEDEYRQWLADHLDDYLPTYQTTLADGSAGPSGSLLGDFSYAPAGAPLDTFTTIADLDVADSASAPAAITTAVGNPGTVYVSQQNLYVFVSHSITDSSSGSTSWSTDILKYNLGVHSLTYDAVGHVDGTPLNSYAMDEYNGQLRVVTESSGSGGLTHTLYVLSDDGAGHLSVFSQLNGIGDNESLRSVLFEQDRAFIVTFHQVDPLFAIDLTDPAHPLALGELVVPGFSTYLYPIDQDHLIGVGQGESPDRPGWFHDVQISLYDVSDLNHPVQVDQRLYDIGWTNSLAQYDPHAFSYFPAQHELAIPLNSWPYNSVLNTNGSPNSLAVLSVDPAKGFTNLGEVWHDSAVERSLRIGDSLYSLADNDMKVVPLDDPSQILADVALPPGTSPSQYGILQPINFLPIEVAQPGGGIILAGPIHFFPTLVTLNAT